MQLERAHDIAATLLNQLAPSGSQPPAPVTDFPAAAPKMGQARDSEQPGGSPRLPVAGKQSMPSHAFCASFAAMVRGQHAHCHRSCQASATTPMDQIQGQYLYLPGTMVTDT